MFIAAASNKIGYGHLSRSLIIADYIYSDSQSAIDFLILSNSQTKDAFKQNLNIKKQYGMRYVENSGDLLLKLGKDEYDAIIVDVMYEGFYFENNSEEIFRELANQKSLVAAIDSLGENSLIEKNETYFDILLRPYVCWDRVEKPHHNYVLLQGPNYAILSSDYKECKLLENKNCVSNLLITFGGSDPKNYSKRIVKLINKIDKRLSIKVVCGPYFRDDVINELKKTSKVSHHNIEIILAPPSLFELMLWADLAIATNGLTKYELAAMGIPCVLLSINEIHDEVNRPFAKQNTAFNLMSDSEDLEILKSLNSLLSDKSLRNKMQTNGANLIDGLGVERFCEVIERELVQNEA